LGPEEVVDEKTGDKKSRDSVPVNKLFRNLLSLAPFNDAGVLSH
jgi:hypothetical protein